MREGEGEPERIITSQGPRHKRCPRIEVRGQSGDQVASRMSMPPQLFFTGRSQAMRSHFANQQRQGLAPDVRSYILRDLVAKTAVDDPVHPGWPKGAPDRQGGRFRPKDEVAAGGNPTSSPTPSSRRKFSARDIPANSSKRPVPLLDSHGKPITDAQGNPVLRPADMPPEMFANAGIAFNFKEKFAAAQQNGLEAQLLVMAELAAQLAKFGQGGPWDAQRVQGQFVEDYRDYATIAIGLYMAAAGVPIDMTLQIENEYARWRSHFDRDEQMDSVYTSLPTRNVRNTQIGYELYQSGRI
jgi:hypothetical protein